MVKQSFLILITVVLFYSVLGMEVPRKTLAPDDTKSVSPTLASKLADKKNYSEILQKSQKARDILYFINKEAFVMLDQAAKEKDRPPLAWGDPIISKRINGHLIKEQEVLQKFENATPCNEDAIFRQKLEIEAAKLALDMNYRAAQLCNKIQL
jgi:hypothetical protein